MKISIYGDSFGYEDLLFDEYHPNIAQIGKSWVTYLRDKYTIDNFTKPASDLFYSYRQFLENYKNYDKNIFLITSSGRLSFRYNNTYLHGHNILSVVGKHKIETDTSKKKALEAAIEYFKYIQDIDRDKEIDRLILKEITNLDPNVLLIDCFGQHGLFNITKLEDLSWGIKLSYSSLDEYLDLRFSHMTNDNNLTLYYQIDNCIKTQTQFKFDLNSFTKPRAEEKPLYIVKKLR